MTINTGDIVVLDADGVAVVEAGDVRAGARGAQGPRGQGGRRSASELQAGELSYEMDGLRAVVEGSAR